MGDNVPGPGWNGSAKYIPIILQTLVMLGGLFLYAVHAESRTAILEQGQADLKQELLLLETRVNSYLDRR
jgi:hypothetical protein